jgi:hypothetical protein
MGLGSELGLVGALAEPGPLWVQAVQLPSAWLLLAAVVGATATGWRNAGLWGGIAILVAVGAYYATLLQTGVRAYYDSAERAAIVWGIVGLGCGPAMGLIGWVAVRWQPGWQRGLVVSVLVGWMWCEAALIWLLWMHGWPAGVAIIEAAAGAVVLGYAAGSARDFAISSGSALIVALFGLNLGLAVWRGIDCAAGKLCY